MTVHWLTSASIRPPFLIMVLSLLPSRFFMTRHLILPGKSEVGGILTEMTYDVIRCSALLEVPAIADPSILADFSVADIFATYETTMGDLINKFLPLRPAR